MKTTEVIIRFPSPERQVQFVFHVFEDPILSCASRVPYGKEVQAIDWTELGKLFSNTMQKTGSTFIELSTTPAKLVK